MKFKNNKPALILIDLQKGFDDTEYWGGNRNNNDAEANAKEILSKWRALKLPLFHIRHSSQNPDSRLHKSHPGYEIKDEVKPIDGEPIITKQVNSAFIGTDLKKRLDEQGITSLVIIGIQTDQCVSTTARMAGNLGYETYVISDATATFDRVGINGEKYNAETIHLVSLASLKDEFATILNTNELMEQV